MLLLCLFDGAKVRRFPHSHNPLDMSFRIPHIGYFTFFPLGQRYGLSGGMYKKYYLFCFVLAYSYLCSDDCG